MKLVTAAIVAASELEGDNVASSALELMILITQNMVRYIHPEFLPNPCRQETTMLPMSAMLKYVSRQTSIPSGYENLVMLCVGIAKKDWY